MAILGPDDPRALTGEDLEEAREYTAKWNELLGIKPMTAKQARAKRDLEDQIFDLLGIREGSRMLRGEEE